MGLKIVLTKFPKWLTRDLQESHSSWLASTSAIAIPFCFTWDIKSPSAKELASIDMPEDDAAWNLWLTLASSLKKDEKILGS